MAEVGALVICTKCGKDNPEGNLFCGTCGERLERRHAQRRQGDRRVAERRQSVAQASGRQGSEARGPRTVGPSGSSGGAVVRTPAPSRGGLDRDFPARTEAPAREPVSPARRTTEPASFGSGPSFLGLGETTHNYLLEDEPKPRRSYGRFITLLILLAAVAAVGWNWDKIKQAATAARDQTVVGTPSAQPAAAPAPSASGLPVGSGQPPATPGSDAQPSATPAQPAANGASNSSDDGDAKGASQQPQSDDAADDSSSDNQAAPADNKPAEPASSSKPKRRASQQLPRNDKQEERIAGSQGDAAVQVADRYLYGTDGVPQDCGRATSILSTAATKGSFEAATKLGVLYATGTCVPFDRVRAYNWYTAASRTSDSAWLERNKSMLWNQMTAAERQQVAGR